MILNHMLLDDEDPDAISVFTMHRFRILLSLNILAHIYPKKNLTRETLKLITLSR